MEGGKEGVAVEEEEEKEKGRKVGQERKWDREEEESAVEKGGRGDGGGNCEGRKAQLHDTCTLQYCVDNERAGFLYLGT